MEHLVANMRLIVYDFTVCNFIQIANKLSQFLFSQFQKLKNVLSQQDTGSYAATTDGSRLLLKQKSRRFSTNWKRQKKGFLEDSIDWLVEKVIWSTLRNFLIGANQKNEIITYQQFWSLWVLSNDNRIHRG